MTPSTDYPTIFGAGLMAVTGLLTLINLLVLGLNLKLYTEIMKEKSQRERKQ